MTSLEEAKQTISIKMELELKMQQLEDNIQNRYLFLQGLESAWLEDSTSSAEKDLWMKALDELLETYRVATEDIHKFRGKGRRNFDPPI